MSEPHHMTPPRKIDTALVGIVITILLQCATAIWWAAAMSSRIDKLESEVAPVRAVVETVARLDERTKGIERIERKLESMENGR